MKAPAVKRLGIGLFVPKPTRGEAYHHSSSCLTCLAPSVDCWRPPLSVAILTHLVTRSLRGVVLPRVVGGNLTCEDAGTGLMLGKLAPYPGSRCHVRVWALAAMPLTRGGTS